MLIKHPDDIRPSEITPKSLYVERHRFLKFAGAGAVGLPFGNTGALFAASAGLPKPIGKSELSTTEAMKLL